MTKKERYSLKQRISFEDIVELSKKVMLGSAPRKLLDKIPDIVILLNKTRQIVFANKLLLEYIIYMIYNIKNCKKKKSFKKFIQGIQKNKIFIK